MVGGHVSFTTATLSLGTHTVTARYLGGANDLGRRAGVDHADGDASREHDGARGRAGHEHGGRTDHAHGVGVGAVAGSGVRPPAAVTFLDGSRASSARGSRSVRGRQAVLMSRAR